MLTDHLNSLPIRPLRNDKCQKKMQACQQSQYHAKEQNPNPARLEPAHCKRCDGPAKREDHAPTGQKRIAPPCACKSEVPQKQNSKRAGEDESASKIRQGPPAVIEREEICGDGRQQTHRRDGCGGMGALDLHAV